MAEDPDITTASWDARIAEFWQTVDLDDRPRAVARMQALVAERAPDDPDARFEMGGIYDSTGHEEQAASEYAAARAAGLRGPRLAQLNIQQGSTLRNIGRVDEAVAMLDATAPDPSIGDARAVFLALALRDAGRPDDALRVAIEALVPHLPRYQRSAAAYARALTESTGRPESHVVSATTTTPSQDIALLRQAVDLAAQARARGDHPFGALLVDESGTVVATGLNTVVTASDPTGHAETNLVRAVGDRFTPVELSTMTMYASTEPCAMCAGAVHWAGIGTVVYALPESELRAMTGTDPKNPSMDLPCRQVFAHGARAVTVRGPFDLPAAREVHAGFWTP